VGGRRRFGPVSHNSRELTARAEIESDPDVMLVIDGTIAIETDRRRRVLVIPDRQCAIHQLEPFGNPPVETLKARG